MKRLSIATWNMENLDDSDAPAWNIRRGIMRNILERIDADVMLLQEINKVSALNDLRNGTFCQNYHIAHTKTAAGTPYAKRNLVVLSRWPITSVKQYKNEKVPAPMWKKATAMPAATQAQEIVWERPILHAEIALNGKTLHAINIHLKSFPPSPIEGQIDPQNTYRWLSHAGWAEGYYISDIKRVGQALETRVLIDTIFSQHGNDSLVVVGGDYNADIGSVPFKTIVGSVDDTSNPDLRPRVLIPCELNVPSSQRFSLLHRGKGNMIDHIAVSQEFYPRWRSTVIFNELLPDKSIAFATMLKFPESDHAPVIARFDVPDSWIT
ncbi:MAG: endonuclease/exonuclease/phosphatase family protein [Nitrososphaera sp.]